jgi:hypothetical protein
MIVRICRWALWLDEWLQARLGRPYNFLLGVGLVTEIVDGRRLGITGTLGTAQRLNFESESLTSNRPAEVPPAERRDLCRG